MDFQVMPHSVLGRPEWADKINGHWRASFDGILAVGAALIEAKAQLPHGAFEAMVEQDLPFGVQTARKLKAIAEDARVSNRAHVRDLPTSWGTLYELTQLSDDDFQRGIDDGIICPDMLRKDLKAFKTPHISQHFVRSRAASFRV